MIKSLGVICIWVEYTKKTSFVKILYITDYILQADKNQLIKSIRID